MDKCHQQLCTNAADYSTTCPVCGYDYCSTEHLTWHTVDGHQDRGLVQRGKVAQPGVGK